MIIPPRVFLFRHRKPTYRSVDAIDRRIASLDRRIKDADSVVIVFAVGLWLLLVAGIGMACFQKRPKEKSPDRHRQAEMIRK